MKITFEGTLEEIKKEIAIFLWEGSIWATKEEIETRLPPTLYNGIEIPDKDSRISQHHIAHGMRKWITSHIIGEQLPSEAKIAKAYGVSRMTARAAIQTLKDERLVYSKNQKTFIA